MFKRLMVVFLVVGLFAAVVAQFFLPQVVSQVVAQGMKGIVGSDNVTAGVVKSPAIAMLGGKFDKVTVQATDAKIDKIIFSDMQAVLTGVQVDMPALITHRALQLQSVQEVDLTATVTQEELARFLNQTVKGIKNATVAITPGKVIVSSLFAIGGIAHVAVTLEGKVVGDGQKIKFVTEKFSLNNMLVGNIGGGLLADIPLVDLKKLPFGVGVREITMDQGKVTIYTRGNGK